MTLDRSQKAHRLAGLVYLLYTLGFLFGITALIGVIINHTQLANTKNTYSHSHFIWQILSFWILFAGIVLTVTFYPSKAALYGSLLWWVCSATTGIWFLTRKQAMPLPGINQH